MILICDYVSEELMEKRISNILCGQEDREAERDAGSGSRLTPVSEL